MDDTLAKDFVAMWQSEVTAMAADRELRESWTAFVTLWAQSTNAALALLHREPQAGSARAAQPAGATPAAAASQPGLGEIERLSRRVAELEQRLAEFMANGTGHAGPIAPAGND